MEADQVHGWRVSQFYRATPRDTIRTERACTRIIKDMQFERSPHNGIESIARTGGDHASMAARSQSVQQMQVACRRQVAYSGVFGMPVALFFRIVPCRRFRIARKAGTT